MDRSCKICACELRHCSSRGGTSISCAWRRLPVRRSSPGSTELAPSRPTHRNNRCAAGAPDGPPCPRHVRKPRANTEAVPSRGHRDRRCRDRRDDRRLQLRRRVRPEQQRRHDAALPGLDRPGAAARTRRTTSATSKGKIKLDWVGNTISGPQDIQSAATGQTDFGGAFAGAVAKLEYGRRADQGRHQLLRLRPQDLHAVSTCRTTARSRPPRPDRQEGRREHARRPGRGRHPRLPAPGTGSARPRSRRCSWSRCRRRTPRTRCGTARSTSPRWRAVPAARRRRPAGCAPVFTDIREFGPFNGGPYVFRNDFIAQEPGRGPRVRRRRGQGDRVGARHAAREGDRRDSPRSSNARHRAERGHLHAQVLAQRRHPVQGRPDQRQGLHPLAELAQATPARSPAASTPRSSTPTSSTPTPTAQLELTTPKISVRDITKTFPLRTAPTRIAAIDAVSFDVRARRVPRPGRAERLRQVHAARSHRRPHQPAAGEVLIDGQPVHRPGPRPRGGLPAVRAVPVAHRAGQRRVRPRGQGRRPQAARRSGPARCSTSSGWPASPTGTRTSCPAA